MKCIVNLATNHSWYQKGQERLFKSLVQYGKGIPALPFSSEVQVGAPTHKENPFAFKLYAINKAREMGYQQIFWIDASVYAVNNIEPIFKRLDDCGIFLEDSGHMVGRWVKNTTLDYFHITRGHANDMRMISAGFIGFDFHSDESQEFFNRWWDAMEFGLFAVGDTVNQRSEQGAASIIARQMGISHLFSDANEYFAYVGAQYGTPNPNAPFHLSGM